MSEEYITVQDLADRLKISKSTVYGWIRTGFLQPGQHYIKHGYVIRVIWRKDFAESLYPISEKNNIKPKTHQKHKPQTPQPRSAINWEC